MTSYDKLIERIKKLLAMTTDRGATEEEADNAMRLAHELLARHNLSIGSIDTSQRDDLSEMMTEAFDDRYNDPWRRALAPAIARLYFCEHYRMSIKVVGRQSGRLQSGIRHHFVGRSHNVEVARHTFEYLIDTIKRLSARSLIDEKRVKLMGRTEENSHYRNFALGCSARVVERLNDLYHQRRAGDTKASDGTTLPALNDLYVSELDLIACYLASLGIQLRTNKQRSLKVSTSAFQRGREAGDGISLHPQLRSTRRPGGNFLPRK